LDVNTNLDGYSSGVAQYNITESFSYPEQFPFEFHLLGNYNSNLEASYRFNFKKKGYKTLSVLKNAIAGIIPVDNYLVTAYREVLHNWDTLNNAPILFSGNPMQSGFYSNSSYFLTKTDLYYEGVALLSNVSITDSTAQNLTNYGPSIIGTTGANYWGPLVADYALWINSSLNKIPQTYTELSTSNVAQKSIIAVYTPTPLAHNSFDFKSGTASQPITFYWQGFQTLNNLYNSGTGLKVSGSTLNPRTSPGIKYEIDLGGSFTITNDPPLSTTELISISVGLIQAVSPSYNPYVIPSTMFVSPYYPTNSSSNYISYVGANPVTMLLESKMPGVSFEITNIVTDANNNLMYFPILANEIINVTTNPYNNKMGGFTVFAP
jgi:hypothetical protein